MAEFVDVFRQFDRMCKANAGCFNCPLHEPDGVSDRCSIGAFVNDSERIEREVMSWAAEHPEPVYPCWIDWLMEYGIIPDCHTAKHSTESGVRAASFFVTSKAFEPISAEIAERLGIKPKEV